MQWKTTADCPKCGGSGKQEIINPEALRKRRKAAGLSLRDMAKRLELSPPYISDVERGNRPCTPWLEHEYRTLKIKG